jgi:hypothetical protein
MLKQRKCKGTHRYTFGLGCNRLVATDKRQFGIAKDGGCDCWVNWLKSERSKEFLSKIIIPKAKKEVARKEKNKDKDAKEKLTDWRKKLQSEVQKIARFIDIGLACLARGHHANQIHGGHVFAKGGNSSMALNLHNIHRQGAHSNHFQNDDGLLREGLKNEYGDKYLKFVSELRRTPQLRYTNLEYKSFYRQACSISNELKKKGNTYNLEQRILLRNEINETLGIYDTEYCKYEG